MTNHTLTLQDVQRILEITDIDNLTEKDIVQLRRKAKKRWHPDTIAHTKPSKEQEELYAENFRLVDSAVDLLRAYISGDIHAGRQYSDDYNATPPETPEEVIRRNAPNIQDMLTRVLDEVQTQTTTYKVEEKVIVLSEGFLVRDMLKSDLEDDILVVCVMSIYGFFWMMMIPYILVSAVLSVNEIVGSILTIPLLLSSLIQPIACILGIIPLSRYWLPLKVLTFIIPWINAGNQFYVFLGLFANIGCVAFVFVLPFAIIRLIVILVKWVVFAPLYAIASAIWGDKRFGMIQTKIRYMAGVSDWYVEELVSTNPEKLESEQLFVLSHLYNEYQDIWRKWASSI